MEEGEKGTPHEVRLLQRPQCTSEDGEHICEWQRTVVVGLKCVSQRGGPMHSYSELEQTQRNKA